MRRQTFASALGQFAMSPFSDSFEVAAAGKRKPKPQPKDPCEDACKPGGSDAACAACQARGFARRGQHMYMRPSMMNVGLRGCDGLGIVTAYVPQMQSFNFGATGVCSTACQKLSNGKCACYDSAGNIISCTCPKSGFSFAQPVQHQYYYRR